MKIFRIQSLLIIISLIFMPVFFQNCSLKNSDKSLSLNSKDLTGGILSNNTNPNTGGSSDVKTCSINSTSYMPGESINGYITNSAVSPTQCGDKVSRICLSSGKFSDTVPLFETCSQQCLHPDNSQAVNSSTEYIYYTKSSGKSQAECDAAKKISVCSAQTGLFSPVITTNRFPTCLVAGQTCAYTTMNGSATPTGFSAGSTVNGYSLSAATYPTLCGSKKTLTCQSTGSWGGTIPLYTACTQKCIHPDSNQPIDQNTSYVYFSISSGTQAQCDAAKISMSCSSTTGLFTQINSTITTIPKSRYTTCNVLATPTITSFKATPTTINLGLSTQLAWSTTNATQIKLDTLDVTGTSLKTVAPTLTTKYTLTASNSAGSTSLSLTVTVSGASTDPNLGKTLYQNKCSMCHGDISVSTKLNKTDTQISSAIITVPEMNKSISGITQTEINLIAKALSTGSTSNNRNIYTCDPNQIPATSILKLTNREFKGSVLSLLDGFSTTLRNDSTLTNLFNTVPTDILREVNYNREQFFLITTDSIGAYFEIAYQAGALVAASTTGLQNYPNTNKCLASTTITQACHQSFLKEFAGSAFRRPLTNATELTTLSNRYWDASLSKSQLIQMTVTGILQEPDFLYRIYDQGATKANQVLTITAHEFATKMSYLLTGLPPDSALRTAADNGTILNATTAATHIDRLLSTSNANDMWIRFFRESLGYDYFSSFTYSTAFLEGLSTSNLQAAMTAEVDNFFVDIIQNQNGTYKDLMKSTRSTVNNSALAQIYGVTNSNSVINLPAQRTGFLTRAAFLAKRSGTTTSPVKRGLEILEAVLCDGVGAPPPGVSAILDPLPSGQFLTTRTRYANKTETPGSTCVACHARMNPLGYSFEMFDSIGRFRTQEKIFDATTGLLATSLAIDTQSTSSDLNGSPINIADAVDLADLLSNNDKAMMCFVKKFKQFEKRKPATAQDNCQMNKALSIMYGDNTTQGTIKNAIKQFILADDFKIWSY